MKEALKAAKSIFKLPKKFLYIGRIKYYAPYFYPMHFSPTIIQIRKLIPISYDQYIKNKERGYGWTKEKYTNLPLVRRSYSKILRLFGSYWYISWGYPFKIVNNSGSWKDKFNSPRSEWTPFFQIWLFYWQLHIGYKSSIYNDTLYEMILWWYYYCYKDLVKAEKTWGWVDGKTNKSTWDKNYIIK